MIKILVVEDEDIIRRGLIYAVNWLELGCVIVGEAIDGEDGIRKIEELKPEIVITDIRMPFKDGIAMLKETKSDFDYECVIISGYSDFEYAKNAINLGVANYLLKPIDFGELQDVILKLCNKINMKQRIDRYYEVEQTAKTYFDLLDIRIFESSNNKPEMLITMVDDVKERYSEKLTIHDYCNKFGVSYVHLNTKFKEFTGYSFNDFLNRYRMVKAIEFLYMQNYLVYEVAEKVGFIDYKYFSQVFKKYVGSSPKAFVDTMNKEN